MEVYFYNCGDPTIKIGKTLGNPVGSANASPNPTGPVNVVNPVLIVNKDQVPASANYCHIPTYGRYYFITSIDWTVAKTAVVSCHCDVLKTFGSKLGTLNFIKGAAAINEVEDPNYPVADTFTVERYNLSGWNNLFLNSDSGKQYLLRVADGHAKSYNVPMVTIGESILYKNQLFTVLGTYTAAYLSAPQVITLPPAEPYPLVVDGTRIRVYVQNGDVISAKDYIFTTDQVYDNVWIQTEYLMAAD